MIVNKNHKIKSDDIFSRLESLGYKKNREMAEAFGVSQQAISNWKFRKKIPFENLLVFSEKNNVSLFLLLGDTVSAPQLINKPIPVISKVHAGEFYEAIDSWPEGVSGEGDPVFSFVKTGPNAFGLIVEGESMLPRFIPGDVVIVDPAVHPNSGEVCVVCINGEVALKIFCEKETEITLKPMNPEYPKITIPKNGKVDFRIIGKVVDFKGRF